MIVEYIRYKLDADNRSAFIAAYAQAAAELDASMHCLGYELTECEEETGVFMLRIEWTSSSDHMNGFRKSKYFPPFFALVKPFFSHIQEMRHYTLTGVVKKK
ncbi:MAG: antibiotic biosynthesis monooxygenase [Chitinophagaceae bacterium]